MVIEELLEFFVGIIYTKLFEAIELFTDYLLSITRAAQVTSTFHTSKISNPAISRTPINVDFDDGVYMERLIRSTSSPNMRS